MTVSLVLTVLALLGLLLIVVWTFADRVKWRLSLLILVVCAGIMLTTVVGVVIRGAPLLGVWVFTGLVWAVVAGMHIGHLFAGSRGVS